MVRHPRSAIGRRLVAPIALAFVLGAGALPASTAAVAAADVVGPVPYPSYCTGWNNGRQRADEVLVNQWRLGSHPVVTLPANRTWSENPLRDDNWQYNDHSLMIVHSLLASYAATGDVRYRDRGDAILRDWITDNPRAAPASRWAWNDQGTAMRAVVLACASRYLGLPAWLRNALVVHGQTLASESFYVDVGNHALNQAIGLLEVAVVVGRADWRALAVQRMDVLAARSIDSQGVTVEQSVFYQNYNHRRYRVAERRLQELAIAVPASFARIALMPAFLAHAILPNGEYEMLGDTDRQAAQVLPGTAAEFSATKGASGTPPAETVAVYRAGFMFGRSGWGTDRPLADEVAWSLRFGPAPYIHGHADHGSLTLYGHGARLLVDPGKYTYNYNSWRTYFRGRTAHNVVTADGVSWTWASASKLLNHSRNATMATARVQLTGNPGIGHVRGVVFSRTLHYLLVDDRLTSTVRRTYRQLWHLGEDANPSVAATSFRTQRGRGNVLVRQLIGGSTSRVVQGRTSPIQGWVAWTFGERLAAPVVEVAKAGTNVRYLTLLVTAEGQPAATTSALRLTATGYSVVITIGDRSERVVVDGATVTITPLP